MNIDDFQNLMPVEAFKQLIAMHPDQSKKLSQILLKIDTVAVPGDWTWTGYMLGKSEKRGRAGSPSISIHDKDISLRRYLYALITNAELEKATHSESTCGNPRCLYPPHWEIVPQSERARRVCAERWKDHEPRSEREKGNVDLKRLRKSLKTKNILKRCQPNGCSCQLFHGCLHPNGYGQVKGGMVHRVIFEEYYGRPIKEGHVLTHECRNKNCCEITHLQEIKQSDYIRGRAARKAKAHEPV